MARGILRNRKNGKMYNVKDVEAVLKRFPRTYDVVPAKELPKEVKDVEDKINADISPVTETSEPEEVVSVKKKTKKRETKAK